MNIGKYIDIDELLCDLCGVLNMKRYVKNFNDTNKNPTETMFSEYYQFISNKCNVKFNKTPNNYINQYIEKHIKKHNITKTKNIPKLTINEFYKSNEKNIYLFHFGLFSNKRNVGVEIIGIIDEITSKYVFCGINTVNVINWNIHYINPFIVTDNFYCSGLDNYIFELIKSSDSKSLIRMLMTYYKKFYLEYFDVSKN
ncbi:hypothetical protein QJ850_gp021 [Acanthamoeba polyphaga mimivirus]|uniref:Uncharacterized protein n=1 Tax=Acanthamoeba polyphaga mimivirus Kroon TaxID=3069720 RepID=A0A0G2Y200_9VIRU|nr:hypothetical protein QJ850_gp021 [Acanthamoeba polyphaga mimivirus]AKI79750.1 hypothetical protein [Acanthamoeba polyphaga mimivirus Kroon]